MQRVFPSNDDSVTEAEELFCNYEKSTIELFIY